MTKQMTPTRVLAKVYRVYSINLGTGHMYAKKTVTNNARKHILNVHMIIPTSLDTFNAIPHRWVSYDKDESLGTPRFMFYVADVDF